MPVLINKNLVRPARARASSIGESQVSKIQLPSSDMSYDDYDKEMTDVIKNYSTEELARIEAGKQKLKSTRFRTPGKLRSVGLIKATAGLGGTTAELVNKQIEDYNATIKQMTDTTLTNLSKIDAAEYETALSELPKYNLGQNYDSYLTEVVDWQKKYSKPLGRTSERLNETLGKIDVYEQELNKLDVLENLGVSVNDTNLLSLTNLGVNLDTIKQNSSELKYKEIPNMVDVEHIYVTVRDKSRSRDVVKDAGPRNGRNLEAVRREWNAKSVKTGIVTEQQGTNTVMDLEGAKDYLIEYYDPEKTQIKSIRAKPEKYTWQDFNKQISSSEYSPYKIEYDPSGNIVSESKYAPILSGRQDWIDDWGDRQKKDIVPVASILYEQGKIKQAEKKDTFRSKYESSKSWAYSTYTPYTSLFLDFDAEGKKKSLKEYGSSDTDIYAQENNAYLETGSGSHESWFNRDINAATYLKKDIDFVSGSGTEWFAPGVRKEIYNIVPRQSAEQIAKSTPKTTIVYNPYTGKITRIVGSRVDYFQGEKAVEKVKVPTKSSYGNVRQTASGAWVRYDADDKGFQIGSKMGLGFSLDPAGNTFFRDDKGKESYNKQVSTFQPGYGYKFTTAAMEGRTQLGQLNAADRARNLALTKNYAADADFFSSAKTPKSYFDGLSSYSEKKQSAWNNMSLFEENYKKLDNVNALIGYSAQEYEKLGLYKKPTNAQLANQRYMQPKGSFVDPLLNRPVLRDLFNNKVESASTGLFSGGGGGAKRKKSNDMLGRLRSLF